MGQIDGHSRLPPPRHSAGHEQGVDFSRHRGEVKRAADHAIWLEQSITLPGTDRTKRRLRYSREHGEAVLALELLDLLEPPGQRLQQEHDRECQRQADQKADDRARRQFRSRGRRGWSRSADDACAASSYGAQPSETLLILFQRYTRGGA